MIMKASGLFLVFMLAASVVVSAQTRTVTNNDLKKYKTERERAERELREDYQRLGLPSPEERAARLRNSRIAQENARRAAEEVTISAQPPVQAIVVVESGQPVYYYPWQGGWYRYPGSYMGGRRLPQQNGYFAGGQFWPTGPITRPRPARLFGRPR
jgi:hypothetical protein